MKPYTEISNNEGMPNIRSKEEVSNKNTKVVPFLHTSIVALLPPPSVEVTRDHPSEGPAVDLRTNP